MKFTLIPENEELHAAYQMRHGFLSKRGDAGLDLIVPDDILIPANEKVLVDLQVKSQLVSKCPLGFGKRYHSYILMPRSSMATTTPLILANSIGLIDSGYTGNLKIPLINVSNDDFMIAKGSRLVQLITPNLSPISDFKLKTKEQFNRKTTRGDGGFGSTGQK